MVEHNLAIGGVFVRPFVCHTKLMTGIIMQFSPLVAQGLCSLLRQTVIRIDRLLTFC